MSKEPEWEREINILIWCLVGIMGWAIIIGIALAIFNRVSP